MGMRPLNDGRAPPVPLVDKMLGDAYRIVSAVANALPMLQYLVNKMELLQILTLSAENIMSLKLKEIRKTLVTNELFALVPLPAGVSQDQVTDSTVLFLGSDGVLYSYESGVFTHSVNSGQLVITFPSAMASKLLGGEVRWNLTYRVIEE